MICSSLNLLFRIVRPLPTNFHSRKLVLPVFEDLNSTLFYPVQYEGEESRRNVFYTGAAPNQQAIPTVDCVMNEIGVEGWVLAGTDYVYPHTTKGVAPEDIIINYTLSGMPTGRIVCDTEIAVRFADRYPPEAPVRIGVAQPVQEAGQEALERSQRESPRTAAQRHQRELIHPRRRKDAHQVFADHLERRFLEPIVRTEPRKGHDVRAHGVAAGRYDRDLANPGIEHPAFDERADHTASSRASSRAAPPGATCRRRSRTYACASTCAMLLCAMVTSSLCCRDRPTTTRLAKVVAGLVPAAGAPGSVSAPANGRHRLVGRRKFLDQQPLLAHADRAHRQSMTLKELKDLMGHTALSMVDKYGHLEEIGVHDKAARIMAERQKQRLDRMSKQGESPEPGRFLGTYGPG